jgi:23S rRNA (guanine745-N1)-methyltransferase
VLTCTVRGCGEALFRGERSWRCGRGHSFDIAKRGQVNLLQPQDRRSLDAGDSAEVVAARRRLAAAGQDAELIAALREELAGADCLLDVGCGEGSLLAALVPAEGWGVDLSAPAIEAAARQAPRLNWVIANADRGLPWREGSFDAVLSITARLLPAEFHRVLRPGGLALIALAGKDDLIELRQELMGEGQERDRVERTLADFAEGFELMRRREIRSRVTAGKQLLEDLQAITYRGGRRSREEKAALLDSLEVTFSRDLLVLKKKRAGTEACPYTGTPRFPGPPR